MKEGWEVRKLGDICNIEIGKTPYRGDESLWDKSKKTKNIWLSIADLLYAKNNIVFDSKEYITDKAAKKSKIVKKGTLLVSFKLTIGRLAFAGRDLFTNEAIAALTIIDESIIDKYFLLKYLSSYNWDLALKGDIKIKGKTLNKGKLKEIEIYFPKSLDEQKRIVSILDKAFDSIEKAKINAEKNLINSKEIFESYLNNIFTSKGEGWEEKKLEEIGNITSSKRIYRKEYSQKGIPFYRIKEIKELANNQKISVELYISRDRYEEIKQTFGVPAPGDLLVTAVGTIGEIYIVNEEDEFYFKDGNILWFKNFHTINPYFLKYTLVSIVDKLNKLSKGSTYNALTIEKFEKQKIFIPKSLTEQQTIVDNLNSLSQKTQNLEKIYQKKINYLEEMKKSFLNKAFNGEL